MDKGGKGTSDSRAFAVQNTREELMDSYNEYVALIETKIQSTERKKILIDPAKDIIALVSEMSDNAKRANSERSVF